jgi:hypothetical protein
LVSVSQIRDNLRENGVDGRIILKYILQKEECETVEWIQISQELFDHFNNNFLGSSIL